jgi:hypothetical protein
MVESFDIQKKPNQKCCEGYKRLYCIMHSTPIPDVYRSKNLPTRGESKKKKGWENKLNKKRGKGNIKKNAM